MIILFSFAFSIGSLNIIFETNKLRTLQNLLKRTKDAMKEIATPLHCSVLQWVEYHHISFDEVFQKINS